MKKAAVLFGSLLFILIISINLVGCSITSSADSDANSGTTSEDKSANASAAGIPLAVSQTSKVYAQGKIVPTNSAELIFVANGVVSEVLFKEGDQVENGQVIARLRGSEKLQSAIVSAELELLLAQQDRDRIIRETSQKYAEALVRKIASEKELEEAEKKRTSKEYKHGNPVSIDVARAELKVLEKQVEDYQAYYDTLKERNVDDPERASATVELNKIVHQRDTAIANLNYLTSMPNALEVSEADANLELAKATYEADKRECDILSAGPDPEEMELAEVKIQNAQAQINSAKAALSDIELTAPFSGTIVQNKLKVGEMVSQASVPVVLADLSAWQIETTDLSELNVVNINEGDKVAVTFDAIPGLEISGKAVQINTLGIDNHGDITYQVLITLDKQDKRLRWNMTASVIFAP